MKKSRRRVPAGMAAVALLAACHPADAEGTAPLAPAFARTEAHVVSAEGDLPVNLVFVADPDDRLWTDLSGVELNGGLDVSHYELNAGDVTEWGRLGNLSIMATVPVHPSATTDVTVHLEDGTSGTFPIGVWTLQSADGPGHQVLEVAEYVAAYPDTTLLEFTATNVSDQNVAVTALDLGLPSVTLDDVTVNGQDLLAGQVEVPSGAEVDVRAQLTTTDEHDFYMTSPRVTLTRADGQRMTATLDPTLLGFSDITGAEIAAFAD